MNARTILIGLLVVGLVVILLVANRNQSVLERGLPTRIVCTNEQDARIRAGLGSVLVLGTGSLAPYIPAAGPGKDPDTTPVAFAALRAGATFAEIKPGDLCLYMPTWTPGYVMHQAAQKDGDGWIMSGLHNERSESWARVTAENFKGIVDRVYVWPQ
jgi:hypothetical protein